MSKSTLCSDLNHFQPYEFTLWHQVTSSINSKNDLILLTMWLPIAWLVSRLGANTLSFTTVVVHRHPKTIAYPSLLLGPFKPCPCYLHHLKPSQDICWFESTISIHWNLFQEIHLHLHWFPKQALQVRPFHMHNVMSHLPSQLCLSSHDAMIFHNV